MKRVLISVLTVVVITLLVIFGVSFLTGCPPMNQQVRHEQQKTEKADECHDFIMPAPTTFIGDTCPRTDQRAEVVGGFVVCRCIFGGVNTLDGEQ